MLIERPPEGYKPNAVSYCGVHYPSGNAWPDTPELGSDTDIDTPRGWRPFVRYSGTLKV